MSVLTFKKYFEYEKGLCVCLGSGIKMCGVCWMIFKYERGYLRVFMKNYC